LCGVFFGRITATEDAVNAGAKSEFNRTRPYELDASRRPLKKVEMDDSSSYPSGHAAYGTLLGLILAEMLPEAAVKNIQTP
jgi:acid phosphatase (class A)